MTESPEFSARLQCNGFIDVTKRAKGGSFVYLAIWLLISIVNGMQDGHFTLLTINALIFLCNGLLRYAHARIPLEIIQKHYRYLLRSFEVLALCNIFHWGLLTAYVFSYVELTAMRLPMLLAAAGMVAAGSLVYSINRVIRPLFPAFAMIPVVIALLAHYTPVNALIAGLCAIFAVYLSVATRAVYNDYWTAQRRALEMEELSLTDSLTQLRNRPFFDIHYEIEWRRACRYCKSISVLLVDLDHFKQINDNYGHVFGDLCLKETAQVMQQNMRGSGDILARYGGEEFIVLLAETDQQGAAAMAQRIIEGLRTLKISKAHEPVNIRCSIGIASAVPDKSGQEEQLINNADKALYEAKGAGRDCFKVYTEAASPGSFDEVTTDQQP